MSSLSSPLEFPGLHILACVARLYNPDAPLPTVNTWIQCDACFRWRRSKGKVFSNGHCVRWFCRDAGRDCEESCDYCRVPCCSCAPSQSYCGYSTTGYSLPEGFSVLIRFRHQEDIEIGKPWLTYRSWCQACGTKSKGIDRRAYMTEWLSKHRHHNKAWEQLTVDAFDFKVDEKIRDLYMLYVRLYRNGMIGPGLRDAVKEGRLSITEDQRTELQSLLEIVEVSRFFDEKAIEVGREHSRQRTGNKWKMIDVQSPTVSVRKRQKKRPVHDQQLETQHAIEPVLLKRSPDTRPIITPKRQAVDREVPASKEQSLQLSRNLRNHDSPLSPDSKRSGHDGRILHLPVPRILPSQNDPDSKPTDLQSITTMTKSNTASTYREERNGMTSMLDSNDDPFMAHLGFPTSSERRLTSFQKRILYHPPPCGGSFSNSFYKHPRQ